MQAILTRTQTPEIPEEQMQTQVRVGFLFALAAAVCTFVVSGAGHYDAVAEPAAVGAHAPTVDQFLAERAALEARVRRTAQAQHGVARGDVAGGGDS